jgi:hypothetical protein
MAEGTIFRPHLRFAAPMTRQTHLKVIGLSDMRKTNKMAKFVWVFSFQKGTSEI